MAKAEGGGQRAAGRTPSPAGLWCRSVVLPTASCLLPLAFSACANQQPGVRQGQATDPLLGLGPPPAKAPGTPGAPSARSSPASPTSSIPPIPVPAGSSSNAALASGPPRALNQDRDLRIGEQGGQGPTSGGAILRRPEPAGEPLSQHDRMQQAPTVMPAGGVRAVSYEQLQAQLASRGVAFQRLETGNDPGEWRFTCSIPSRQNPSSLRTYKGTGRTDLAAIQAVLEQIEREN
jgi:hypothetical protein